MSAGGDNTARKPLTAGRFAVRLALWFWNEPRPLVRFWAAFALLAPLALIIWWLS